ncbi:uncharacterized protein LOC121757645 [Salvia splendens]|uniref:uncharacterized protein LOC121757645 n=1 Tax=Salvia splendens TaxID=180675 RepID=UPI001C274766|nr:uncharacterized protein LOC121757645 [Salvia splendens]
MALAAPTMTPTSSERPNATLGTPWDKFTPMNVDGLAVGPQGDGSSGNHPPNEIIRPMNHTQGRESGAAEKVPIKLISMADMVRGSPNSEGLQAFLPENIQNIRVATTSNGIPAIYFSGAEIQKLATNLGHAIVGKFSHSIPSSHQIQKALDNIKFSRGFTWKFINAKHVFVQFEDMEDYARLLSGPKGTPVWFIDRHPMRVFKWTPDFDAYCESPIAAIWCNLIGLPIHLFDQSALFAIGKLLGTPIQVDRATANKSRLSFARICVEIDITKPPPEEIILDICGREMVQQVKWDKIPSYCRECKHVGHKSDLCYAAGRGERPLKRNFNVAPPKQPQQGDHQAGKVSEGARHDGNSEWIQHGKNKTKVHQQRLNPKANAHNGLNWSGPDIMGEMQNEGGMELVIHPIEEDHSAHHCAKHTRDPIAIPSSSGGGRGGSPKGANKGRYLAPSASGTREKSKGSFLPFNLDRAESQTVENHMSTNRYYSLMARENFVENELEDMGVWEAYNPPNGDEFEDCDTIEVERTPSKNAIEVEWTPSKNAEDTTMSITEGDTCYPPQDHQLTKFQGGLSHPPGTNLHC